MNKFYAEGIKILIVAGLTVTGIYFYLQHKNKDLEAKDRVLAEKIATLQGEIAEKDKKIAQDFILLAQREKESQEAIAKWATSEANLKQMKKELEIIRATTVLEVQTKVAKLYNDNDLPFQNDRFSVKFPTMSAIVFDAEQFKVNYPILHTNFGLLTKAHEDAKGVIITRDEEIKTYKFTVGDLTGRIAKSDEKDKLQTKRIEELRESLKTQKRLGKLEKAGYTVLGLAVGYLTGKSLKK